MERSPQNNEQKPPQRPTLAVDLTTCDGHWFNLVCAAQTRLEGAALQAFNREIGELLWRGNGTTYNDLFRTINAHLDLVDISGAFEAYAPKPPNEQADGREATPQASQHIYTQAEEEA